MKQFKICASAFKCILLAGIMTACNHDDVVGPTQTTEIQANNQNAKISSLTRLVKDGERTIQYVKSGKFFGKISALSEPSWSNYRYEYTYDDNNPAGDLWISKKQYQKSNNLFVQEWKYKVVNGRCVASEGLAQGYSYQYIYNAQGLLDEIKMSANGSVSGNWKYSYSYYAPTSSYRLDKVTHNSVQFGPQLEFTFLYTQTPDKYTLNEGDGNMDRYLPIFGKFSDVLVAKRTEKSLVNPANPSQNYNRTYTTDADGLVVTRTTITTTGNNPPSGAGNTETLKYSDNWQGI
jgi:hypothetical protein